MTGQDASPLHSFVDQAKRQLRRQMRATRSALPRSAIAARSARIVDELVQHADVQAARSLALFWPMADKNEVDLRGLDAWARSQHKQVFYPFMDPTEDGYRTGFRRVDDVSGMLDRGRGFCEPPSDAPRAVRGDVDLVLVPALAVSEDGYRIGYGIGFYDATLPDVSPPALTLCVAFSFQLVVEVPHGQRDVPCHGVVTDVRALKAC